MINYLFIDWRANELDLKGRFVMLTYRTVSLLGKKRNTKILFFPVFVFNKLFIQWILGIEIGTKAKIGANCRIFHGVGLVIHPNTIIGENCTLRHGVTIGNKILKTGNLSECPVIGKNVEFGANSSIIGDITIGDSVIIGAGCVVVKSIPNNSVVVGNPARIINKN